MGESRKSLIVGGTKNGGTPEAVNAIMIFMYHSGADYWGLASIAIEWAPYGDWGKASEVSTGDYSQHQYYYRVYDSRYDYWGNAN